jgi:hypothetical protein
VVFSIRPGNKTPEQAVENIEFTSTGKNTHVSLAVQDHPRVFLDHKVIVHYKFIAQGHTANQKCYLEVLTNLRETVQKKRPELWHDKWILHHDNALCMMR